MRPYTIEKFGINGEKIEFIEKIRREKKLLLECLAQRTPGEKLQFADSGNCMDILKRNLKVL